MSPRNGPKIAYLKSRLIKPARNIIIAISEAHSPQDNPPKPCTCYSSLLTCYQY